MEKELKSKHKKRKFKRIAKKSSNINWRNGQKFVAKNHLINYIVVI